MACRPNYHNFHHYQKSDGLRDPRDQHRPAAAPPAQLLSTSLSLSPRSSDSRHHKRECRQISQSVPPLPGSIMTKMLGKNRGLVFDMFSISFWWVTRTISTSLQPYKDAAMSHLGQVLHSHPYDYCNLHQLKYCVEKKSFNLPCFESRASPICG